MSRLDVPVIDSHVYLWNHDRFRLGWLDNIDLLDQNYELATYLEHTQDLNLDGFVYVETGVNPHYAWLEARWAANWLKPSRVFWVLLPPLPWRTVSECGLICNRWLG